MYIERDRKTFHSEEGKVQIFLWSMLMQVYIFQRSEKYLNDQLSIVSVSLYSQRDDV